MTSDFLFQLTRQYRAYVGTFREADGLLPDMLRLKLEHTQGVVQDARSIMGGEAWDEPSRVLGEACALLHDAGRYEQFKTFGTFQDSKSVDHAAYGVRIIREQRWLDGLPVAERNLVLATVALHNRRTVSPAASERVARFTHLVRDADKLDIFRVLEQAIADGSLERNPEIAWGLQHKGAPSRNVVEAIRQGHSVSYTWIRTLSDFILIQVGWLIGGLHYPTSYRLAAQRKVLEFRETFLKTLSDDPGIEVCCQAARDYFAALSASCLGRNAISAAPASATAISTEKPSA
ncbi:MAG TPA: HD domain-containing protein [Kiritimatiellia bacterium]|nr:HD domain-containing protein [Kiritimatiellia bacterium]HRU70389.1 HD domain-containing protein [Kiritimatiellia bacterium]